MQVYKEEKEIQAKIEQEKEEILQQTKRAVYPLYFLGSIVISLLWIG